MATISDPLIKLNDAFAELSISKATGYRLIRQERLGPVLKIGRRRSAIRQSDIERFKDALPTKTNQSPV